MPPAGMSESSKPFYCSLCNKGYAKQQLFAQHEASYEHNHALRRRDLQSQSAVKAKIARAAADENADGNMRRLDAPSKPAGQTRGFKKGTFKSAFAKAAPTADDDGAAKQGATTSSSQAQAAPEPNPSAAVASAAQDAPQAAGSSIIAAGAATRSPSDAVETEAARPKVTYTIDGVTVPRYDPFHPTSCETEDDEDDLCAHAVPWSRRDSEFAREGERDLGRDDAQWRADSRMDIDDDGDYRGVGPGAPGGERVTVGYPSG